MATTKAPREKLTLRDTVDLLSLLQGAIEDHVDEIELNEGALPDWLAQLLDEVDAALMERVDALAKVIDDFEGFASSAKATKDRAARRQKVWENAVKSMKAYGMLQVQRIGGGFVKGKSAVLRIHNNSAPATTVNLTDEQLLEICAIDASNILVAGYKPHPLSPYLSVTRVVSIDKKALAAAFEARRDELARESELLGETDLPDEVQQSIALNDDGDDTRHQHLAGAAIDGMRRNYVTTQLESEFPGVSVVRGVHLRIG